MSDTTFELPDGKSLVVHVTDEGVILDAIQGGFVISTHGMTADEWWEQLIKWRLEALRQVLRDECMSYGEMAELQSLAEYIEPGDVELLEPAGVPEFPDDSTDEAYDPAGEPLPHGRCDICGAPCDENGCPANRNHLAAKP